MEPKGAVNDGHHRLVEVGIVVDDDRVLAAELGDDPRDHPAAAALRHRRGRGAIDSQADTPRAGEHHEARGGMGDQRRAHVLAPAGEELEGRRRDTSLEEHLVEAEAGQRRLLGRLHDDGVAGDQRRGGHAGEDRQRKVPRRDHDAHAAGEVPGDILLAGDVDGAGLVEEHGATGVVLAEVDRLGDVGIGLAPRLPHLMNLEGGKLVPPPPQDPRRPPHGPGPIRHGDGPPRSQAPRRRIDCPDRLRRRWHRHPGDQPSEVGRIVAIEPRERRRLSAIDDDGNHGSALALEPRSESLEGRAHRAAPAGIGEISQGLVVERVAPPIEVGPGRRCRRRHRGPGGRQEHLRRHMLDESGPQEGLVRRVLEEPSDEVRHPGDELTVRHVDAQSPAGLGDRPLLRVTHAVEHLDLERRLRQAEVPGNRHAVRQRSKVVAAEGRPQPIDLFEEKGRRRFVAGVCLPLLLPHRHRPSGGPRMDRLVVPIRALDEAHPHRRTARAGPGGEVGEIADGVAQIGLEDDPEVVPVAELLLESHRFEDG